MWISELENRLESLDIEGALTEAIDQTKEQYADLNRGQWAKGLRSDGSNIEPAPYSPGYARKRQREGLQTAFIDLNRTGALYGGYAINQDSGVMRLSSEVDYEQYVSRRYTPAIYGLTDENMSIYRGVVRPIIMQNVKEQLYG